MDKCINNQLLEDKTSRNKSLDQLKGIRPPYLANKGISMYPSK